MAKAKKQGGKRKGAGRKPIKDKKVQISLYIRGSELKLLGGKEKVKTIINNELEHRLVNR